MRLSFAIWLNLAIDLLDKETASNRDEHVETDDRMDQAEQSKE